MIIFDGNNTLCSDHAQKTLPMHHNFIINAVKKYVCVWTSRTHDVYDVARIHYSAKSSHPVSEIPILTNVRRIMPDNRRQMFSCLLTLSVLVSGAGAERSQFFAEVSDVYGIWNYSPDVYEQQTNLHYPVWISNYLQRSCQGLRTVNFEFSKYLCVFFPDFLWLCTSVQRPSMMFRHSNVHKSYHKMI